MKEEVLSHLRMVNQIGIVSAIISSLFILDFMITFEEKEVIVNLEIVGRRKQDYKIICENSTFYCSPSFYSSYSQGDSLVMEKTLILRKVNRYKGIGESDFYDHPSRKIWYFYEPILMVSLFIIGFFSETIIIKPAFCYPFVLSQVYWFYFFPLPKIHLKNT